MVARLQAKASQIGNILTSLEKKYDKELKHELSHAETNAVEPGPIKKSMSSELGRSKHDHGPPHKKRYSMKIDPIPPFNPEKKKLTKTPEEGTRTDDTIDRNEEEIVTDETKSGDEVEKQEAELKEKPPKE